MFSDRSAEQFHVKLQRSSTVSWVRNLPYDLLLRRRLKLQCTSFKNDKSVGTNPCSKISDCLVEAICSWIKMFSEIRKSFNHLIT